MNATSKGTLKAARPDATACFTQNCRIGLMAEKNQDNTEFLKAAYRAMQQDRSLTIVGVGPRPLRIPDGMDWITTGSDSLTLVTAMEKALDTGSIQAAVALHYPFSLGVTTIGRIFTPDMPRPMFMASGTGVSAAHRPESLLKNAILGLAVARASGVKQPVLGILSHDATPQVLAALARMVARGYPVRFDAGHCIQGSSVLQETEQLQGDVDVCVTDSLTGNILMKVFGPFSQETSAYRTTWGYGPSIGEGWDKIVCIVARSSDAELIAHALLFAASMARAHLPAFVADELRRAKAAGLYEELNKLAEQGKKA